MKIFICLLFCIFIFIIDINAYNIKQQKKIKSYIFKELDNHIHLSKLFNSNSIYLLNSFKNLLSFNIKKK